MFDDQDAPETPTGRTPMKNTPADNEVTEGVVAVAAGQLRSIIERVERLEQEKKEVAEQVKEVMAEAKANGFCTKTLRKIIAERKKSSEQRSEEEAMLDLYMHALGMISSVDGD